MSRFVKLVQCNDVIEAESIRIRLITDGIPAVIQGGEVATTLSPIVGTMGYLRVEVPEEELDRAKTLLASDREMVASAGDWNCSRCGEHNEPAFELCWSCGQPRDRQGPIDRRDASPPEP